MANRWMVRNFQTLEKAPVCVYGNVAIGATGAPTLSASKSKGIASITRTGTGAYTVNFGTSAQADTYQRLMDFDWTSVGVATSAAVSANVVQDNSATGNVHIQFVSAAGTAVDLANGETLLLKFLFSNSSAP